MSRARFVAAARLEFLAEVIYYSEVEGGLGARFAAAVEEAAARAVAFPQSGSPSLLLAISRTCPLTTASTPTASRRVIRNVKR